MLQRRAKEEGMGIASTSLPWKFGIGRLGRLCVFCGLHQEGLPEPEVIWDAG